MKGWGIASPFLLFNAKFLMTDVGLIVRWKEHNDVYELESHHQFKISQFDNTGFEMLV